MNEKRTEQARDLWEIIGFNGESVKFYGAADDAIKQGRKLYGVMNFRIETTVTLKPANNIL